MNQKEEGSFITEFSSDIPKRIPPFRNHPSYILEKIWGFLLVVFLLFFQNIEALKLFIELIMSGRFWEAISVAGAGFFVVLLVVGWHINRWYRTTIEVKDYTITIKRKTLNRLMNSISVQNISNINIERNIFEMVMGTCKVKLDTNSLSTANSTDVAIVLRRQQAEDFKQIILEMMHELQSQESSSQPLYSNEQSDLQKNVYSNEEFLVEENTEKPDPDHDIYYSHGQVIRNCLVNTSLAALFGTIIVIISALITAITEFHSTKGTVSILGIIMIVIVAGSTFFSRIIKTWLADFNFSAKRRGDKIYVKCGLIKENYYTVPVDKINAIILESKMLGRLFGYASLKVINVGGENEDVDGMKLLLADREDRLLEKMKMILPEFDFPVMKRMNCQPMRVLVKKLINAFISIILFFVISCLIGFFSNAGFVLNLFLDWIWIPVLVLCIFIIVGIIMSYRITRMRMTQQYFMFSTGIFGRKVVFVPYDKMQYVKISQGPVERMFHIESANLYILASRFNQIQHTGCFDEGVFDELIEHMRETYISNI